MRSGRAGKIDAQAPDVVDVGLPFAASAKDEGLLQPYKVSAWETIPDRARDPDGYWYAGYYGVLVFAVNADRVSRCRRTGRTWHRPSTETPSGSPATSAPTRRS